MTPKEKAKQLVESHLSKMPPMSDCEKIGYPSINQAKLMANITVKEILEIDNIELSEKNGYLLIPVDMEIGTPFLKFWNDVKAEIELL